MGVRRCLLTFAPRKEQVIFARSRLRWANQNATAGVFGDHAKTHARCHLHYGLAPHYLPPNTSPSVSFNFLSIPCSFPSVILCWHCSNRNKEDGGNPVFFPNSANDISPRCFLRKAASFLSSSVGAVGTHEKCRTERSVCGMFSCLRSE